MLAMAKSLARTGLFAAMVVACWLIAAEAASACPSCKEALAADSSGGDLISGFFWSILFMLSMPFLILTGLGTLMYWSVRNARREQAQRASAVSRVESFVDGPVQLRETGSREPATVDHA